jgi:hypothetical protein
MNTVSFSQYTTWANCSYAWKLKYVDAHRFDENTIHTIFGTVIHEVVQEWLHEHFTTPSAAHICLDDIFKEKLITSVKDATLILEDGAKQFVCDRPTLEEFYTQGTKILSYIQDNASDIFPTENTKLFAIEYPIDVEVRTGVRYIGFVDIITHNELDNTYTLYDLKTSNKGWSSYQKNDKIKTSQLLLYKKFFSELLAVPLINISVEYLILKRNLIEGMQYHNPRVSSFSPSNGKPSVSAAWAEFSRFLDSCFSENGEHRTDMVLPAASKNACRFCPYLEKKELCSYGVSAS